MDTESKELIRLLVWLAVILLGTAFLYILFGILI